MLFVFPYVAAREDGDVTISFPGVMGAHTWLPEGTAEVEARAIIEDCLVTALGGYVEAGQPLPKPPKPKRGQKTVELPALMSAKLALYEAMRAARLSNAGLARRLGLQENAVRRLLDLDHRSHIGEVERALAALGRRLVVRSEAA
jgi:antitoxin HicB